MKKIFHSLKNSTIFSSIIIFLFVSIITICATSSVSLSAEKIVIAQVPQWNYDVINVRIIQRALEEKGYKVDIEGIYDLGPLFAALSVGDLHMYPSYWLPTLHKNYIEKYPKEILAIGNVYGAKTPVGWVVPKFVVEEHGIHSFGDLKGKAKLFKGKIYGYEAGTGGSEMSLKSIEEYGLKSEYKFVPGSVASELAELQSGLRRHKPVIVVLWRPHPIFAKLPVQMLEDPKDVFGTGYVGHAVNTEFANQYPDVVHFLENYRVPINEMEAMMLENEDKKVPETKLGDQWYEKNKTTVEKWWK